MEGAQWGGLHRDVVVGGSRHVQLLTIDEVAEALELSRHQVRRLINRKDIASVQSSPGRTMVPAQEVARYAERDTIHR